MATKLAATPETRKRGRPETRVIKPNATPEKIPRNRPTRHSASSLSPNRPRLV